jgi:hypothetical protein
MSFLSDILDNTAERARLREYVLCVVLAVALTIATIYFLNSEEFSKNTLREIWIWFASVIAVGSIAYLITARYARELTVGATAAWLVAGVGLPQAAAAVLWFVSALSVGRLVQRFMRSRSTRLPWFSIEATVLGVAFWLLVWGIMLHFRVNYRATYVSLCLVALVPAVVTGRVPIQTEFRLLVRGLRSWIASVPYWNWVLGVAVIGWVLRWSSFPTVDFDDQALHLRLWTDLVYSHQADFSVEDQVWSVAPFASDLLRSGVSLIAGADARGASNLALAFVLLLLVLRSMQTISVGIRTRWLLGVLFTTTPMLGLLLLTGQSELLLSVVGLAGLSLAVDAKEGWRGENVMGVLAAVALCAATKLPGAILGAFVLLTLAIRLYSRSDDTNEAMPLRWSAVIVLSGLAFVAAHSYGLAWEKTGNPFFPLYNGIFKSPFFPAHDFQDARWNHGFSFRSYIQAFFKTSDYLESRDYAAGWQYLILFPPSLLAVWRRDAPASLRMTLVPTLGFGLAMFAATQYWRYLFPAMPMASVLIAGLFTTVSVGSRTIWTAAALFCIVANLAFFQGASWLMRSPPQLAFSREGEQALRLEYAPVAILTDTINRIAPGSRVLYPMNTPFGATLYGEPLYVNWYAPARAERFDKARDPLAMSHFLADERVDFVILEQDETSSSASPNAVLRDHLASMGAAIAQEGGFVLYRLGDAPILYRKVFDLKEAAHTANAIPSLQLPISDSGVIATQRPEVLATVLTEGAIQLRYFVRLRCPKTEGFFMAQVDWQNGHPYYRFVACDAPEVSFSEAVPIPPGAREGGIYLTARDTPSVVVEDLVLEVR